MVLYKPSEERTISSSRHAGQMGSPTHTKYGREGEWGGEIDPI